MSQRAVVLFNLGPPFGGFRTAVHPGVFGLNNPAAFAALDEAIQEAFSLLSAHPPDSWPDLHASGALAMTPPRFEGREGVIDVAGDAIDDAAGEIVMRAFLPFSKWRLGGWAVYEAWHRDPDGTWDPFSDHELASVW